MIFILYSKLNPKLTPADQFDIIKVTTDSVFPLPSEGGNGKKKDVVLVVCSSISNSLSVYVFHSSLFSLTKNLRHCLIKL